MKKTSEKPKERKIPIIYVFFPQIISFVLTILAIYYSLSTNYLLNLFKLSIPHEININTKISLLARIAAWISVVLVFNVFSVIGARVATSAINPLKDNNNQLVTLFNKILSNSIEQTIIFIPLLANFIINDSNRDDNLKQAVVLAIIWIIGRILFSLAYYLGYMVDFTQLRGFGFFPTIFPSVILSLRLAGINLFLNK